MIAVVPAIALIAFLLLFDGAMWLFDRLTGGRYERD